MQTRYKAAKNVTLIGAATNLILAIIKILFGILGRSHALIADGIHSLSDLLTDALVLFAAKYGSAGADPEHPYGHRRIETAATFALAALLIMVGSAIIWSAATRLFYHQIDVPAFYVLIVAFISIVFNELLFHLTRYFGKRYDSQLLIANAWHHRSDALSSLVVFVGVVGSLLGYAGLDAIAAIIVGILIIKMAASLGWVSIKELIDTAVDPHSLEKIRDIIKQVPGVNTIHQLRTRSMANQILVDVHVIVNPYLSVSEGHHIADKVQTKLCREIREISDVTVHIDVEDDESFEVTRSLPTRAELLPHIKLRCHNCLGFNAIVEYRLNYIAGGIELEIVMEMQHLHTKQIPLATQQYQTALADIKPIKKVVLLFK
ncbi:MAG: cation diffusion facilitator family transporter [Pseudomonadota bacterium]